MTTQEEKNFDLIMEEIERLMIKSGQTSWVLQVYFQGNVQCSEELFEHIGMEVKIHTLFQNFSIRFKQSHPSA